MSIDDLGMSHSSPVILIWCHCVAEQARAKKAEERRAKKEAEAAARAKAKEPAEGSAKAGPEKEAVAGADDADDSSAAAIAAPEPAGTDKEAENGTKDAASVSFEAAPQQAAQASEAAGKPAADGMQGETAAAAAETAKVGDAIEVDAAPAAAGAAEDAGGEAQASPPELAAENGDTAMTEVSLTDRALAGFWNGQSQLHVMPANFPL